MLMRLFRKFEWIAEILAFIGVLCLTASIAVALIDILGRKSIGFSILGIVDISQLLVMTCVCLAMPLTFIREGHICVDFVTDALPARALAALRLGVTTLCAIFVATLAYFSYAQAALQIDQGDASMTLAIPIVFYWMPLMVGLVASVIASMTHALCHLMTVVHGVADFGAAHTAPTRE